MSDEEWVDPATEEAAEIVNYTVTPSTEGDAVKGGATQHTWVVCDVGNFYTEYECTKCGTRTCVAPEDLGDGRPSPGFCPVPDTPEK